MTCSTHPERARRRALAWAAAGGALALLAGLPGCASAAAPRYLVTLAELQQALAGRFPRRYPVGGLLELQLQLPQLALRPERDQLNAVALVQALGVLLQGRQPQGLLDVDFGLRYESADHTIRTERLQVNSFAVQGLPTALAPTLARQGSRLAQQALDGVVLHQLRPQDVALADGLGLQPERIRVTAAGLLVEFGPRRPS